MPSPIDSLIFDLDGTLWDSTATVAPAWSEVLMKHRVIKKPLSPQDIADSCGLNAEQLCQRFLPHLAPETARKIIAEAFVVEESMLQKLGGALFPEVKSGIEQLKHRYQLFIVSNCSAPYMTIFLDHSGIGQCFADSESYGRRPLSKGENIVDVIQRNVLENPVYIGDTLGDEEAAKFAKIPFYYAQYGFGKVKNPMKAFKSFEELTTHFLSIKTA